MNSPSRIQFQKTILSWNSLEQNITRDLYDYNKSKGIAYHFLKTSFTAHCFDLRYLQHKKKKLKNTFIKKMNTGRSIINCQNN